VAVSTPPPYERTAQRPSWPELPAAVRARVETLAAAPVRAADVAGGGFTRGFAGLLRLADGRSVFVKAAPLAELPVVAASYRREVEVLTALPAAVPCPRLLWSEEVAGWVLLGTTPVAGRMPGRPWTPADVASAVRACEAAAEALTPGPAELTLTRMAEDLGGTDPFRTWFGAVHDGGATSDLLSPWATRSLPELQRLVDQSGPAIDGETACHGDLRPDNLVLDGAGRSWICDWNWLSLAAPWTDLVGLLVTVPADALDADAVLRASWLADGVDDEAIDAWLALIAAFMLSQARDAAPGFASPWLAAHRAFFGTAALDWLERRRAR
jgi:aminoglycoside phosphotransferase (APT) family kinase protein